MVGIHEDPPHQPRIKREGFDISPSPGMTSGSNSTSNTMGFSFGQSSPAPQTPLHQTFSTSEFSPQDIASPRHSLPSEFQQQHLGHQQGHHQSTSTSSRQGAMDSSSFFNNLDFTNDILDMSMINSPGVAAMNGADDKRGMEPKGLLEKYVGSFQHQQQQHQRVGDFKFGPDGEDTSTLGPNNVSRLGMGLDDSGEDSPNSRPGDMETNSGDSLHQTHRQFLQHLQSMTAQQFHQAAMGSTSTSTNLGNNSSGPMNLGNRPGSTSWGGGYQTSSARFDDDDLLALMGNAQSPDEPNQPGKPDQANNGEFRQMMNDLHQHHLTSETDAAAKLFSVSQQNQNARGSYAPIDPQGFIPGQHQSQGPIGGFPASAPAAFQDDFPGRLGAETDHFSRLGGIGGNGSALEYGGYSYHPQSGLGGNDHGLDMALQSKGIPVGSSNTSQGQHATPHSIDSLPRRLGQGTPSLVDGSVSSLGNASLFSSIMGGKWGVSDGYRQTFQTGEMQGQAGQGGYHDSMLPRYRGSGRNEDLPDDLDTAVSVMIHGDGTGESGRSPDSLGDDRDGDIKMKNGDDSKIPISRGRTKSTSKMGGVSGDKAGKGKPKLARRSSSIAAAASGGSAVRNENTTGPNGGVGKAPRAPSKTRPTHKRTGSNTTRVPNSSVPGPASSSSSGPGSGNGTVSPAQFDYALPSLEATFGSPRADAQRKRSDSAAMALERGAMDMPLFRGSMGDMHGQHFAAQMMTMAHQRRSGMARTPSSASTLGVFPDKSEEGTWRRHSMNDAVRPDLISFGMSGSNGDGMATVDEAAIEDGDAEDSPQILSAEELAKARISRRRLSHNEVERKRRETINEKIQELETLLPPNVVAGAIAAREVESIKEEDEDNMDSKPLEMLNGKGKKIKPRNRKVIKKAQVPDKLCKGTVLCLTVDLVKQLQEMLQIKSAREQQLMMQVQALQSQLGVPSHMMDQGLYGVGGANDPFSGLADLGTDDLRSINELDLRALGNAHGEIGKHLASPLSVGHEDSAMADQILNDDMAALVDFRD